MGIGNEGIITGIVRGNLQSVGNIEKENVVSFQIANWGREREKKSSNKLDRRSWGD